MMMMEVIVDMF